MTCDVRLPELPADVNKYSRGKLTVMAGSARYPGAAVLAARAAQRMGAGYTQVVTAERAVDIVRMSSPSLVVQSFESWNPGDLAESRPGKPAAVCVGPGFVPDDPQSDELVLSVLKAARCPVLVDGGGLGCLGSEEALGLLRHRAEDGFVTVVTPHGGEAARLAGPLGVASGEPGEQAATLSDELSCIVVLKGSDTYISYGGRTEVMTEGTPALAKAGTGDVLAGMIAALLAQALDPFDAAVFGTVLHARAGRDAASRLTQTAVCAEDVVESIPFVLPR